MRAWIVVGLLPLLLLAPAGHVRAESGYDLWLRYTRIEDARLREAYSRAATSIVGPASSVAVAELRRGLSGLLGTPEAPALPRVSAKVDADGAIIVGTPASSPIIAALGWQDLLSRVGEEGYVIKRATVGGRAAIVIASNGDAGVLYGTFHFLRLLQTYRTIRTLDIMQRPRLARRLLNHWDNLDGSIERGYAGRSLWNWAELPGRVDPRVIDYARANASIGLNGTVINSVNANPKSLTHAYLEKAAALAKAFRPYGLRVYLAANFAAPKMVGELQTADSNDPAVVKWWRDKADEIYRLIPDFGGFVVKANSEGQPGPQDYGRTHADGANLLADALAPHGGIVMWRAFVYDAHVDPDRVKRAYAEFVPLDRDSKFRDNVFVQVKNGPLDFMPREPFHPMFGTMSHTLLMAELQITQEYLGQSTHLVYLAPMWKEFFDADTFASGAGSRVSTFVSGIAGVANTGSDRNWTGHHFGQANWYAFGRLAWDPDLTAEAIADEWIAMTWTHDRDVAKTIRGVMLDSREAFVDYTMPLGLHHLIGGDHYAPMPENAKAPRPDWTAVYYHHADATGIGFDRTPRGSDAVAQYRSPLREQWSDPKTTPETLLLWFHRLPWDYALASGGTLWDGLVRHYTRGAAQAKDFESRWQALRGKVDEERYQAVLAKLHQQAIDAAAWRDKCLTYFQQFSGKPLPAARSDSR